MSDLLLNFDLSFIVICLLYVTPTFIFETSFIVICLLYVTPTFIFDLVL